MHRSAIAITLVLVAATAAAADVSAPLTGSPRCFGAAARDPRHPCVNPALRLSVRPTPSEAEITPNEPCTPVEHRDLVVACRFGVIADPAETVALIGDSHAGHWRAALAVVARARKWQVLSVTRTACGFSRAVKLVREPRRSTCTRWTREVIRWFRRHPEIHLVVIAQLASSKRIVGHSRTGAFPAQVRGYLDAWRALPASVRHIVVIRDTPRIRTGTLRCVQRAMAARVSAGPACAVRRGRALPRDPSSAAAARAPSSRVRTVRLNRFLCDRRRCYPVVGGVLAFKDTHHLTRLFATTLGPYLLRAFDALPQRWR